MQLPDSYIVLKCVTTDIDSWYQHNQPPELIEIAGILVEKEKQQSYFSTVIKPSSCEYFTTEVFSQTGLSQEELEQAPTFQEYHKNLAQFTKFHKHPIISFTSFYDTFVLQSEYNKIKAKFPHRIPFLDFYTLTQTYGRSFSLDVSLAGLIKTFDINVPKQRRALDSCQLYLKILQCMQRADDESQEEIKIHAF